MRNSDYIFFGTIFAAFAFVLVSMLFMMGETDMPYWIQLWWVVLVPLAISKALFPNSRLTRWLNK